MNDILTVHVFHSIENSLHNLGTFFISEVNTLFLPLFDEIGEGPSTHELHA